MTTIEVINELSEQHYRDKKRAFVIEVNGRRYETGALFEDEANEQTVLRATDVDVTPEEAVEGIDPAEADETVEETL